MGILIPEQRSLYWNRPQNSWQFLNYKKFQQQKITEEIDANLIWSKLALIKKMYARIFTSFQPKPNQYPSFF